MPDLPDWHKRIYEIIKSRIEDSKKVLQPNLEEIEKTIDKYVEEEIKKKCDYLSKVGSWPCKYCTKVVLITCIIHININTILLRHLKKIIT